MSICNSEPRKVTVYALMSSADDKKVRYIGQTTQTLYKRLLAHVSLSKRSRSRHLNCWISQQLKDGNTIEIVSVVDNAIWDVDECRIIAEYRASGVELVNATSGGQGTYGDKHPRGGKGKAKPKGFGAKISAAKKGLPGTPWTDERKAAQSSAKRGVPLSSGHAAKIAASLSGKPKSIAHRHALSEIKKGVRLALTPEQEAKRILNAAISSSREDVRAKRSATMKQTLAIKRALRQEVSV